MVPKNYSRYVRLMKIILPFGIVLSVGFAFGWPYILSLSKEGFVFVDHSQPEIRENRMMRPHYLSTDEKGQPFHVDADWAKELTNNLSDLTNPQGSMTMLEGQTFNVKAKQGHYDHEKKVLKLEGDVILTSTDGDLVKTKQADVTIDDKVIEGNSYIEGEGPAGKIMAKNGFKIESRAHGLKIITLKGPSRVEISNSSIKKHKAPHAH